MFPGAFAEHLPEKPAVVMAGTGAALTYAELEERSIRMSRVLHAAGLRRGDVVALLAENNLRTFEVYWAAIRSGLYITAVNHHLAPAEVAYVVRDSGAVALIVSAGQRELAGRVGQEVTAMRLALSFDGPVNGYDSYEDAIAAAPKEPLTDQPRGAEMLYSSGTTGRPKGIRPPLPDGQVDEVPDPIVDVLSETFGLTAETRYISPAPLYHAGPLRWCAAVLANGGTVVVMDRFDAEQALAVIEKHRITHGQFVPTMFVRMLKLPASVQSQYDLSSLRMAVHAAAPCPVDVKHKMIEWWGPIIEEYYGSTETHGITMIDSAEWTARPGSVGRSVLGTIRICDEEGLEVLHGEIGTVYFERDALPFEYHGDPVKTRAAQHPDRPNWVTVGDLGHIDDDGYLYLDDRKDFMIISGGVNIYPQEIENAMAMHPLVADVAVVGIPDAEMGQLVKAFVQAAPGVDAGPRTERELIGFVRGKMAHYKAPRSVAFVNQLPRTETGKLAKGSLMNPPAKTPTS